MREHEHLDTRAHCTLEAQLTVFELASSLRMPMRTGPRHDLPLTARCFLSEARMLVVGLQLPAIGK